MRSVREAFELIYKKEGGSPWTFKRPPKELINLLREQKIKSCRVLEVGCGEGYMAVWLASKGFDVTAIDFSRNAIKLAKKHAKSKHVKCRFVVSNWKSMKKLGRVYDFIFDWRFLNEITSQKERKAYLDNVHEMLSAKGKYLSAAFCGDFEFWGTGRIRTSSIGVKLCFPSTSEIIALFRRRFRILEKRIIKVPEKGMPDIRTYFYFMEKK